MKIFIDADGCPVVRNTVKLAKQFNISCVIICDTAHRIEHDGAETIIVEQGADSVDFRLVNLIGKGDIVITQDYGLAAMCLSKQSVRSVRRYAGAAAELKECRKELCSRI